MAFQREEGEKPKKGIVYAVIIIGVVIAAGLVIGFFSFAGVDTYLDQTKQSINLYKFYDSKIGSDENSVYFLGNSGIGYSIYPPEINQILKNKGYDITAYNLFLNSETVLEMALQAQKIIDANPKLVIIGCRPRDYEYDSMVSEHVILVHDQLKYDDEFLTLLTKDDYSILETACDFNFKKKFVKSALQYHFSSHDFTPDFLETNYINDYTFDPIGKEFRQYKSSLREDTETINNSVDERPELHPVFTADTNQQKQALIYLINKLHSANIQTLIINLPSYPLHSKMITAESRQNYYEYLNSTGSDWVDYEYWADEDLFMDDRHFTYDGAFQFAPVMADLIIQEMT